MHEVFVFYLKLFLVHQHIGTPLWKHSYNTQPNTINMEYMGHFKIIDVYC